MKIESSTESRSLNTVRLSADLAVVGGGLAGTCAAITAARHGLKVVLAQDRPVLGGNSSSEVRLWTLGATSHMSNNNRWAREGGLIDEILVENMWRNREGNPHIFDTVLLEKAMAEPNLTLLLNTAVYEAHKTEDDSGRIASVRAFCSQNSTRYDLDAPLFCDSSGDGILGFLAGAAFRMGAESKEEFGEKFAPSTEYGELLGHSLYFYTKDTGKPVRFIPPAYAISDVEGQIPRFRSFSTKTDGCRLWWIEYGGRLDTVHDTERIKWELWEVVYGVWDYIKNSGKFPDAANLTLEWVGAIPGKRESRRFEGDAMLRQQDVVEQTQFADVVAYGGWSIDLHPADGVFSEKPGCNQWHSKGIFGIPYRCYYSRNVSNLFLAGRIISVSHVAFGSTRVMATCAHGAQAVGTAAALCLRDNLRPRDLNEPARMRELQRALLRDGQHLPGLRLGDGDDLARTARITASSELVLSTLPADGPDLRLENSWAMLLPLKAGPVPAVGFTATATEDTELIVELRTSSRKGSFTPDQTIAVRRLPLPSGRESAAAADFSGITLDQDQYVFFCAMANPAVTVKTSQARFTGILSLANAAGQIQQPKEDIGIEAFEFWRPRRRPDGHNLAITLDPPQAAFAPKNVVNGLQRPLIASNAWAADPGDPNPALSLEWDSPQTIKQIVLSFDADFDHPMESVLHGHPENAMPQCVRGIRLLGGDGALIAEVRDNHQTRNVITLDPPVMTNRLTIACGEAWGAPHAPSALFEVRCYAPGAAE